MSYRWRFEIVDKDLAGRIGKLRTPSGTIETPALLPVIDVVRQELPVEEIAKLGFKAVITNAYLLRKRFGSRAKRVHEILNFKGVVMTDSGAYQILQYGSVDVSSVEIVEFQKSIGSDIAVILDVPTGNAVDRAQAQQSVEETLRRAREALQHIDPENRIWTLPIQGGPFLDLLAYSARESAKLEGYTLYALGSPTVLLERYEYATLFEMIATAREQLPATAPLHLFGAGHPSVIPFAVALGVDMFDSASYILYARDDRYMTARRTYHLEDLTYLPCSCPVCTRYTAEELREMPKQERTRLLALHNLYVLRQSILETKQAIREGRLWELLEEKSRNHPALARGFRTVLRRSRILAKLTPRTKGGRVWGVLLYGEESLHNPRVLHHLESVTKKYKPPREAEVLVLAPFDPDDKPFSASRVYRRVSSIFELPRSHVVGYSLYFGAIPAELSETFPLSQHEANIEASAEVVAESARRVVEYVRSHRSTYKEVVLVVCRDLENLRPLAKKVAEELARGNVQHRVVEISCTQELDTT
ncbi:MAG: tRNA guanosine(15) transglycosylase TgtA [Thermoproteota archaeon]